MGDSERAMTDPSAGSEMRERLLEMADSRYRSEVEDEDGTTHVYDLCERCGCDTPHHDEGCEAIFFAQVAAALASPGAPSRERVEGLRARVWTDFKPSDYDGAYAALDAVLALYGQGEPPVPVAWRIDFPDDGPPAFTSYKPNTPDGAYITPLYAIPTAREAQTQGWRDIATAPKDGTEIVLLGRLKSGGHLRSCVSRWYDDQTVSPYVEGWLFSAPGYSDLFEPTHWMPLPAVAREVPK